MDIETLLHSYPLNLLIAAVLGALLAWLLISWLGGRAARAQREDYEARLARTRAELMGELDTKNDDIAHLNNRLQEADHLTQRLGHKAQLMVQEQQKFADLKDRYLKDVGRARNLLKTRGDVSSGLERQLNEATARYEELHGRWETERKRYAALVTDKNQLIAELESKIEGTEIANSQDADPSLHSYSHGQLEVMLVDLRQQLAERETQVQGLQNELQERPALSTQDGGPSTDEAQQLFAQLSSANAKIAEKDRDVARLREQLLQQVSQAAPAVTATLDSDEPSELQQTLAERETELARLQLEVDTLRPAAKQLRRLQSQLQSLARNDNREDAALRAAELELEQTQGQLLQYQAQSQLALQRQADGFQRQLNAKVDTIGRLNRQLQAR